MGMIHCMTVGELRAAIENMGDDTPVRCQVLEENTIQAIGGLRAANLVETNSDQVVCQLSFDEELDDSEEEL